LWLPPALGQARQIFKPLHLVQSCRVGEIRTEVAASQIQIGRAARFAALQKSLSEQELIRAVLALIGVHARLPELLTPLRVCAETIFPDDSLGFLNRERRPCASACHSSRPKIKAHCVEFRPHAARPLKRVVQSPSFNLRRAFLCFPQLLGGSATHIEEFRLDLHLVVLIFCLAFERIQLRLLLK